MNRWTTALASILVVVAGFSPLDAQTPSPALSPGDSADLRGQVRRAIWRYYRVGTDRNGVIGYLGPAESGAQSSVGSGSGFDIAFDQSLFERRPDPDAPLGCNMDPFEQCIRGRSMSSAQATRLLDPASVIAANGAQETRSSFAAGREIVEAGEFLTGEIDFSLPPRLSLTEASFAAGDASSSVANGLSTGGARGRSFCHADRGAYCLGGDWDTAPCTLDDFFECHPKTAEENAADRAELMSVLISAAEALPGDGYIVGQTVYAAVKFREYFRGTVALRNCKAERWWCSALEGFANHHWERYDMAEDAFRTALAEMPADFRCDWTDQMQLLDFGDRGEYRSVDCDDREPINARLWWLSDPLYFMPGNDRFTEQMARHVGLIMHENVVNALEGRENPAHTRQVLRYGFEDSWQTPSWNRLRTLRGGFTYPSAPHHFVPRLSAIEDPYSAQPEDWNIGYQDQIEGYLSPWGFFTEIPAQVGFFRRGDSARVVAATDLTGNQALAPWEYGAGLYLSRSETDDPVRVYDGEKKERYDFDVMASAEPYLVSVEAIAMEQGAGRVRLGHVPPFDASANVAISDILVYRPWGWDPRSLDEVRPAIYGRTELRKDEELGLFWEVYGAEQDESVSFVLQVLEPRPGFLRVIGQALGITSQDGLRIEWTEPAEPDGDQIWTKGLRIDLSGLDEGEYTFELRASVGGLTPVITHRVIRIVD